MTPLQFLAALLPVLGDLFEYVTSGTRSSEADERHARAVIRAAFDARSVKEIPDE